MTPMIEMLGGKMLRNPACDCVLRFLRSPGRRVAKPSLRSRKRRLVPQPPSAFAAALSLLLLSGCLGNDGPPPVTAIPTTAAACEALRPDMPIRYSGKGDTAETVRQVRAVNARFVAACS